MTRLTKYLREKRIAKLKIKIAGLRAAVNVCEKVCAKEHWDTDMLRLLRAKETLAESEELLNQLTK